MFSPARVRFSSGSQSPSIAIVTHPDPVFAYRGIGGSNVFYGRAESDLGTVSYQWQKSTNGGSTWQDIDNNNNDPAVLVVQNIVDADDGTRFRFVASVAGQPSVTSMSALLRVPILTITQQPANTTASGGSASFTVSVAVNIGYSELSRRPGITWQRSSDGGSSWVSVSEVNSSVSYTDSSATSTLSLSGLNYGSNGDRIRALANIQGGLEKISNVATVTVPQPVISFSQHPSSTTASNGVATFAASASDNTGAAVSYQWQRSTDSGSSWSDVAGGTSSTLTLSSLSESSSGHRYRVAASSQYANTAFSNSATLTVPAPIITILQHPQSITTSSSQIVPVEFSVSATVNDGSTISYQWQELSTNIGATWTNIAVSNSATLAPTAYYANGWQYRVVVTAGTSTATSTAATLTLPVYSIARAYGNLGNFDYPVVATESGIFQELRPAVWVGGSASVYSLGPARPTYSVSNPVSPGRTIEHMYAEASYGDGKQRLYITTATNRLIVAERTMSGGGAWSTIATHTLQHSSRWIYKSPEMLAGDVFVVGSSGNLYRRYAGTISSLGLWLIANGDISDANCCTLVGENLFVSSENSLKIASVNLGNSGNSYAMSVDSVYQLPSLGSGSYIIKGIAGVANDSFSTPASTSQRLLYIGAQHQTGNQNKLVRLRPNGDIEMLTLPSTCGGVNAIYAASQGGADVIYVLCSNEIVVCTALQPGYGSVWPNDMRVETTITGVQNAKFGSSWTGGFEYIIESSTPSRVHQIVSPTQDFFY